MNQIHDSMVTSDPCTQEEYADSTDERIDVSCPRETIARGGGRNEGEKNQHTLIN